MAIRKFVNSYVRKFTKGLFPEWQSRLRVGRCPN
jgi:hypothetical protein